MIRRRRVMPPNAGREAAAPDRTAGGGGGGGGSGEEGFLAGVPGKSCLIWLRFDLILERERDIKDGRST